MAEDQSPATLSPAPHDATQRTVCASAARIPATVTDALDAASALTVRVGAARLPGNAAVLRAWPRVNADEPVVVFRHIRAEG